MVHSRPSSFGSTPDQQNIFNCAQSLLARVDETNLQLVQNVAEFNAHRPDQDELDKEVEQKDPVIVAADVETQMSFLRNLKFQYVEQNAKDRYIKTIVSDIDDAPMVTAEDNNELLASNVKKKEKLKLAKANLAEKQRNIRTLVPLVEQDYLKVKKATDQATILVQKIIEARLALTRLRQTHPHPHLTVPLADQKLVEQVTEMQNLNDEIQSLNKGVQGVKERVKKGALEVESLGVERADAEKSVKKVDEDDGRLIPLYDWYIASTTLLRSIHNLQESYSASENELRLTYRIDVQHSKPYEITIMLIFAPDTRRLAAVKVSGLEEMGVDVGDVIDAHVQIDDAHGVVAAILARARADSH